MLRNVGPQEWIFTECKVLALYMSNNIHCTKLMWEQ